MNRKFFLLIVFSMLTFLSGAIAASSADHLMNQTIAKAESEHKNILLRLCKPGCPYCEKLSAVIDSPENHSILSKYFVLATLERGEGEMSNPGTEKYFDRYNAHAEGTPFTVILDPNGKLITTSRANGGSNIGFPSGTGAIDWFMAMLQKGAPNMTAAERQTIQSKLQNS